MLHMNFIEPVQLGWEFPIVFVSKKDRSLRYYIQCRNLNAVTIKDAYRIPRMQECQDSVGEGRIFSTLDANYEY